MIPQGAGLEWDIYHSASEQLAGLAQGWERRGHDDVVHNIYRLAAQAEGLAFLALHPETGKRTRGITLVSWVALLQKGGEEETARAVARDWLGSLNPDLLPDFAINQLREMLELAKEPSTKDALAAIVAEHGGVMGRAGDEKSNGEA